MGLLDVGGPLPLEGGLGLSGADPDEVATEVEAEGLGWRAPAASRLDSPERPNESRRTWTLSAATAPIRLTSTWGDDDGEACEAEQGCRDDDEATPAPADGAEDATPAIVASPTAAPFEPVKTMASRTTAAARTRTTARRTTDVASNRPRPIDEVVGGEVGVVEGQGGPAPVPRRRAGHPADPRHTSDAEHGRPDDARPDPRPEHDLERATGGGARHWRPRPPRSRRKRSCTTGSSADPTRTWYAATAPATISSIVTGSSRARPPASPRASATR